MSITLSGESLTEYCTFTEFARRAGMSRHTLYQWARSPKKLTKHNVEITEFGGQRMIRRKAAETTKPN